jgi:hypothetical protein
MAEPYTAVTPESPWLLTAHSLVVGERPCTATSDFKVTHHVFERKQTADQT